MKSVEAHLLSVILHICILVLAADELKTRKETSQETSVGEDVTLRCRYHSDVAEILLEWLKHDLNPKEIFFFRGNRSLPTHQNALFKDRVDLLDRRMKDGDVSVVLKNVTTRDSGTYECIVHSVNGKRYKRAIKEPSTIVVLTVKESGAADGTRGHAGLVVALAGVIAAAIAVSAFVVLRHKRSSLQYLTAGVTEPLHVPI